MEWTKMRRKKKALWRWRGSHRDSCLRWVDGDDNNHMPLGVVVVEVKLLKVVTTAVSLSLSK